MPKISQKQWELANALARRQSQRDNAPIGSVGAPSGVLPEQPTQQRPNYLQQGLLGLSMAPGIGDAAGLLADAHMYATDPESRTIGNYAMSGAGLLPFVPGAAIIRDIPTPAWMRRGPKTMGLGDNPTPQEALELMQEQNDFVSQFQPGTTNANDILRSLEVGDNNYAWPASMAMHGDIEDYLGIPRNSGEHGMLNKAQVLEMLRQSRR